MGRIKRGSRKGPVVISSGKLSSRIVSREQRHDNVSVSLIPICDTQSLARAFVKNSILSTYNIPEDVFREEYNRCAETEDYYVGITYLTNSAFISRVCAICCRLVTGYITMDTHAFLLQSVTETVDKVIAFPHRDRTIRTCTGFVGAIMVSLTYNIPYMAYCEDASMTVLSKRDDDKVASIQDNPDILPMSLDIFIQNMATLLNMSGNLDDEAWLPLACTVEDAVPASKIADMKQLIVTGRQVRKVSRVPSHLKIDKIGDDPIPYNKGPLSSAIQQMMNVHVNRGYFSDQTPHPDMLFYEKLLSPRLMKTMHVIDPPIFDNVHVRKQRTLLGRDYIPRCNQGSKCYYAEKSDARVPLPIMLYPDEEIFLSGLQPEEYQSFFSDTPRFISLSGREFMKKGVFRMRSCIECVCTATLLSARVFQGINPGGDDYQSISLAPEFKVRVDTDDGFPSECVYTPVCFGKMPMLYPLYVDVGSRLESHSDGTTSLTGAVDSTDNAYSANLDMRTFLASAAITK